jgi:dsDNA-binding SOS-regulon protein
MDRFLDSHPEIAEQLEKSPRIIDDPKWVANHPELQAFLADHPGLRQQFDQHPWAFMQAEERYDRTYPDGTRPDITRREVAVMDQFLDKHPEIAEQLQKNPRLIDDKKWVANHPELQAFLADHSEVRQAFDDHPYAFMRDEERYDQHHDMNGDQVASFHEFLQGHGTIASELSKNPSLATNQEYLENHEELQSYLKANPQVTAQLQQNPQSFVKSAQGSDTTAFKSTLPGTEKPK